LNFIDPGVWHHHIGRSPSASAPSPCARVRQHAPVHRLAGRSSAEPLLQRLKAKLFTASFPIFQQEKRLRVFHIDMLNPTGYHLYHLNISYHILPISKNIPSLFPFRSKRWTTHPSRLGVDAGTPLLRPRAPRGPRRRLLDPQRGQRHLRDAMAAGDTWGLWDLHGEMFWTCLWWSQKDSKSITVTSQPVYVGRVGVWIQRWNSVEPKIVTGVVVGALEIASILESIILWCYTVIYYNGCMTYVFNVFQYVQAPQRVLFSLLALPLRTPQPGVVPVTVS
jgi:hypothetical protein